MALYCWSAVCFIFFKSFCSLFTTSVTSFPASLSPPIFRDFPQKRLHIFHFLFPDGLVPDYYESYFQSNFSQELLYMPVRVVAIQS